ncbi:MAG: tRNA pseudouridine(38-40) synthase TruA [Bacilli bacterium]|jgi:tRNA pseudouridine38-40 synthase|nr:tRNA pseudouridine(38-40) synthase TruA [Bacilli bacterium]
MIYFCKVSYLGAAYKGFERQPRLATIQGKLEDALKELCQRKTLIHGAGRTDAGVSAKGQTFSFSHEAIKDEKRFLYAFNRLLPSDIAVLSLEKKGDGFDARHSSTGKRYSYSFRIGSKRPLESLTVSQFGSRLFDYGAFAEAIALYKGTHDFRDFTSKGADIGGFKREISKAECSVHDGLCRVDFVGNGFMTYQVRIMVGVALKVGFGKMGADEVEAALRPSARKIFSYKAPAEGLTLEEVYYEPIH